jgi:hypothetical protein
MLVSGGVANVLPPSGLSVIQPALLCQFVRTSSGRAGSVADAMRSTPPQCAAGKRARRFDAATSCCVIRVDPNGAPGASVRLTCVVHTHP